MALKDPGATINYMKHNEQPATDRKYPEKILLYVMLCVISYHLYNLKNVKNTHGGVLLLVNLLAKACNLLKVTLLHECLLRF